jgi:hypothetical protein
MSWVQYEVWGIIDGHDELIECVGSLREAEDLAENELEYHDEVYILKDEDGIDLKEVARFKGL